MTHVFPMCISLGQDEAPMLPPWHKPVSSVNLLGSLDSLESERQRTDRLGQQQSVRGFLQAARRRKVMSGGGV